MNLYIDGWFLRPPMRGIGQYLHNLIINIPKDYSNYEIKLLLPNNFNFKNTYHMNIKIIKIDEANLFFWYNFRIPKLLNSSKNNLIFFPFGTSTIIRKLNAQIISTIHDVSYLESIARVPISLSPRRLFGRIYLSLSFIYLVKFSKIIFTVSDFARKGIETKSKLFFLKKPKLFVVWNAATSNQIVLKNKKLKEKIFLCVTGSSPQKNTNIIFKMIKQLPKDSFKGWTLVIVGLDKEFSFRNNSGLDVFVLKYQSQEKLKLLYQKTYALLFPSFYESFGIPLVDALQNNCQIVASSKGATKEVCGRNAYYFNPKSYKELMSKLFILKKKFPEVNTVKYPDKIIYNTWSQSVSRIIQIINNNF